MNLSNWRDNVGLPVFENNAPKLKGKPATINVVSWNMNIGLGRLGALIKEASLKHPLIILLQEVYRADDTVPINYIPKADGGRGWLEKRLDIVSFARKHSLSLCYFPSMRNGKARSDRGNAILSTIRLSHPWEIELWPAVARRVTVAASVEGLEELLFISVHLDVWRPWREAIRFKQAQFLIERLKQKAGQRLIILGADLNTATRKGKIFNMFADAGFAEFGRDGNWQRTVVYPFPIEHDFILHNSALLSGQTRRARSPYGSDHFALIASVKPTWKI